MLWLLLRNGDLDMGTWWFLAERGVGSQWDGLSWPMAKHHCLMPCIRTMNSMLKLNMGTDIDLTTETCSGASKSRIDSVP